MTLSSPFREKEVTAFTFSLHTHRQRQNKRERERAVKTKDLVTSKEQVKTLDCRNLIYHAISEARQVASKRVEGRVE